MSKNKKTIITIQHPQSVHHIKGMVGSWTDWDLTELGKQQTNKIGEKLKSEISYNNSVIYTSDLKRTKQTAQIIGIHLNLIPVLKKELRERNLGKCCGKSVEWLRENKEKEEKTIDDKLFSDGKSRRDEWERLRPFFEFIVSNECNKDLIIIVSHGDLLSVFNSMFLGLGVESLNNCEIFGYSGGVSFMFINNDEKRFIKKISDIFYVLY